VNSRVLIYTVALGWFVAFTTTAIALTPKEREKIALAVGAIDVGIAHNKALQEAAKMSDILAENAIATAKLAVDSAQTSETKAAVAEDLERQQHDKAVALEKENRPLRELKNQVSGPWWFPGGRALLYGAKKSAISLVVIVGGGLLLFVVIKVAITMFTGGTLTAGLSAVGGIFSKLGKGALAIVTRKGKAAK